MTIFAKNYVIEDEAWAPLSDIMGQDYETTLDYIIHVNGIATGVLRFTYRPDAPASTDLGREYTQYTNILVAKDTGDDVYLRASQGKVNVEIFGSGTEDDV